MSEVATNAKTFVALAVAPELTFNMSEVVKSDIVSVPASTLKVSAPAPPESSSFSAPPVRLSFPPPPYRRSKPPSGGYNIITSTTSKNINTCSTSNGKPSLWALKLYLTRSMS